MIQGQALGKMDPFLLEVSGKPLTDLLLRNSLALEGA